jgi:hypothetical protein
VPPNACLLVLLLPKLLDFGLRRKDHPLTKVGDQLVPLS